MVAEYARLKAQAAAERQSSGTPASRATEDAAANGGGAEGDGTEQANEAAQLESDVSKAQRLLSALVQLPEEARAHLGDLYQAKVDEAKATLDELVERKRRAKPVGAQVAAARRDMGRAAKAAEAAKAKAVQLQEQAARLREQLDANLAAQEEAKAAAAKAEQDRVEASKWLAQLATPEAGTPSEGTVPGAAGGRAVEEQVEYLKEWLGQQLQTAVAAAAEGLDEQAGSASEAGEAPEAKRRKSDEAEDRHSRPKGKWDNARVEVLQQLVAEYGAAVAGNQRG